jgi:hypothetical protein
VKDEAKLTIDHVETTGIVCRVRERDLQGVQGQEEIAL